MAESIDTAFVTIRPDTRNFAAETKRQVSRSIAQSPARAPIAPPRKKDRDLIPRVGIRGPAISGLLAVGTTLTGVTAGAVAFTLALRAAFNEVEAGQAALAQTNAVIKSTGGIAGVTSKEVVDLASQYSKLSGIDDEVVQGGENIILTFKNVRNVVGEGNDVFTQATQAAVDLAKFAGGAFGDINSASKQLGKALNDPIKGMTALQRSGITFSAGQKETIKSLVATGHTLTAQKIILKEVESQVGGSAEAYGKTLPGAIDRLKNSVENLLGSGLDSLFPQLAAAGNAAATFFEGLEKGGQASAELKDAFKAVKSAVVPLFNAIKSEGPRFISIFKNIHQIVRNLLPTLKVLGIIVGVTLVVGFKVAIRAVDQFFKSTLFVSKLTKKAIFIIIDALDKLLSAAAFVGNALNTIFPGDPFAGVTDSVNTAHEALQSFKREIEATDGKQVTVTVNVETVRPEGESGHLPSGTTNLPDAAAGTTKKKIGGAEPPGKRQKEELGLSNQLQLDQAKENVAAQKEDLRRLIAFYAESVRLSKLRHGTTRVYQTQQAEAQRQLNDLFAQGAADAKQAASDAKTNADNARQAASDALAAAVSEHRATLEANIQIAALTKLNIRDDKRAYAAYIKFLLEQVAVAQAAGIGIRAAQLDLKVARRAIAQIIRDAAQARKDEQQTLLEGAVTLAGFTPRVSDDAKALSDLIRFYKSQVHNMKLSRVERQKYAIELAQTRKDLHDLKKEQDKTASEGASFGKLAANFLTTLHGFASNLAGNLIPRGQNLGLTTALAAAHSQAVAAGKAAAATQAGQRTLEDRIPLGKTAHDLAQRGADPATAALESRESAQGQPTSAQFERLLHQNAAILRVLRRMAQDQDHPEAKFNRKHSPAAVVVGVS